MAGMSPKTQPTASKLSNRATWGRSALPTPTGGSSIITNPVRKHTTKTEFDVRERPSLPRVEIVLSYVNADGVMIEAAAKAGAKGIVSAATGAGRPTPAQDAAFDKAYEESGMLMCLCSRVASGRVVRSPGLKRKGFVASDNLQPWKARILLSLALSKTTNADEIQRMFDTY